MSSSRDFTGKVALVTGSSSGIGEGIAVQFAKYGAKVVITGRAEDKIAAVVDKCNQVSPTQLKALGMKCDVAKDSDLRELVNKIITTHGKIDILVNNAGIAGHGFITDPNFMDNFDSMMATNLRAPFLLTHLLVPHLVKSKGNIVNISSIAGLHPFDITPTYSASKAALDMFTKCIAIDLGPKGVRVNSVCPAVTKTPALEAMGDAAMSAMEKICLEQYPLRRMGEVDDVAKFVLFLASDDASFITGLVGSVDGGSLQTVTGVSPK